MWAGFLPVLNNFLSHQLPLVPLHYQGLIEICKKQYASGNKGVHVELLGMFCFLTVVSN